MLLPVTILKFPLGGRRGWMPGTHRLARKLDENPKLREVMMLALSKALLPADGRPAPRGDEVRQIGQRMVEAAAQSLRDADHPVDTP